MESRTRILAALISLVAIAVIAATAGTHRINVLAVDLRGLLELDLPLERAAGALGHLAFQRTADLTASRSPDRDGFGDVSMLSEDFAEQLEAMASLLAATDSGSADLASLRRALEVVTRAEAAFRAAQDGTDASLLLARSRAVESAVADLAAPSTRLTDLESAQITADERNSLVLLAGLAISSLVLGAVLVRYALRVFSEVQTLQILVPVCSDCHSVRNDPPFWRLVDRYLEEGDQAKLTHGRCPRCEATRSVRQRTG